MNHTIDGCYSKHGYPPWMKQRFRNNVNQMDIQNNYPRNLEEDLSNDTENKQLTQSLLTSEQIQ